MQTEKKVLKEQPNGSAAAARTSADVVGLIKGGTSIDKRGKSTPTTDIWACDSIGKPIAFGRKR